jgi:8-oxo-dGTP pyrophosphatase MutT (NUDIX family)
MRQSEAAVALIRQVRDGQTHWLAQWNDKWGAFNFIAGHRRPDETFRECLVREIAEELHLSEGTDYRVSAEPPIHLEFVDFSQSTQTQTHYIMELFNVELNPEVHPRVESNSANRWLSAAEIEAGQTQDGQPVSATMKRLHKMTGTFSESRRS